MAEVIGVWSLRGEVVGVRGSVFALTWEMGWQKRLQLEVQGCKWLVRAIHVLSFNWSLRCQERGATDKAEKATSKAKTKDRAGENDKAEQATTKANKTKYHTGKNGEVENTRSENTPRGGKRLCACGTSSTPVAVRSGGLGNKTAVGSFHDR